MPTQAEMFETMSNWHIWTGADYAPRKADAEGRRASAEEHRAVRDQRLVDPLHVLASTHDLIESLAAGRWDAITEARVRGATWGQVARTMNRRVDEVLSEYTAMVGCVTPERPGFVDIPRC